MRKKNMNFIEAFDNFDISLFGDADKDKVPNVFDCKPFDPNRDGLFGRAINVATLGKYGQSKEDYKSEKTLRRIEQKKALESKIEQQKAINTMIEQQIKLRKLKFEKQSLLNKKKTIPRFSLTEQAIAFMVGIPFSQSLPQRSGYHIEKSPPKLPKGYRWKKTPKSKQESLGIPFCARCGVPMVLMPNQFGSPVWRCPVCSGINYIY